MAISIPGEFPLKLPADFKAKWVEALRSGDYEQGGHALNLAGKFCCLGVACDLAGVEWTRGRDGYFATESGSDTLPVLGDLGAEVYSVLQQDTSLENVFGPIHVMRELASCNDLGAPFSEIADWIEENL